MSIKSAAGRIRKKYEQGKISQLIRQTEVKGKQKLTEQQVVEVYNKYGLTIIDNPTTYYDNPTRTHNIRQYVVKENKDTIKAIKKKGGDVEKFIQDKVRDRINQDIKDYEHRDALIRTGQYDEIRTRLYKVNYVESMQAWGIDESLIKAIEKASPTELAVLFTTPDAKKDSKDRYALPVLGFYYGELKGEQLNEVEERIRDAIIGAGINIPDEDYNGEDDTPSNAIITYQLRRSFTTTEASTARNMYRRLPKDMRPVGLNYGNLYHSMLLQYQAGKLKIRRSKAGNLYIPFVGSTNPKSKNPKFLSDFVEFADALGVDID